MTSSIVILVPSLLLRKQGASASSPAFHCLQYEELGTRQGFPTWGRLRPLFWDNELTGMYCLQYEELGLSLPVGPTWGRLRPLFCVRGDNELTGMYCLVWFSFSTWLSLSGSRRGKRTFPITPFATSPRLAPVTTCRGQEASINPEVTSLL